MDSNFAGIDISAVRSAELPPNGFSKPASQLQRLPIGTLLRWDAPLYSDVLESSDLLEEDESPHTLLGSDQGIYPQEGALRSAAFRLPAGSCSTSANACFQLRWIPEGGPLCARESSCSLYLICVTEEAGSCEARFTATFELSVGSLRRVLCHDFRTCPQWGCADFGNLMDACSDRMESAKRIHVGMRVLEAPACFRMKCPSLSLPGPPGNRKAWCLEGWSRKQAFGPAAYASPPLGLHSCEEARLLIGVGPDSSDDLVAPQSRLSRSVASEPLAAFVGAPPGKDLRFALEAGGRRRIFFHRFSFTAGFAGTRCLIERAGDACVDEEIEVWVEILGHIPAGDESEPELLPGI